MSSLAPMASSHVSSLVTSRHSSPTMSAAYSLDHLVGSSTHAPAYPECCGWHRPYTWPPVISATASRSVKPILPNTSSRICITSFSQPAARPCSSTWPLMMYFSAPGSRPMGGMVGAFSSAWSTRPGLNSMAGPPECSMKTYDASTHRSLYEMPGNLFLIGSRKARPSMRPLFSGSLASDSKRIPAPLEPPVWVTGSQVPELCHASRTNLGPRDPSSQSGLSSSIFISSRT
mmetsp:Transcript_67443/g.133694  ORF Transcript_67443/g.133694 Transcript_67443/m.133694 type:complete len:231 (-) Transcript_67443:186-878(-)